MRGVASRTDVVQWPPSLEAAEPTRILPAWPQPPTTELNRRRSGPPAARPPAAGAGCRPRPRRCPRRPPGSETGFRRAASPRKLSIVTSRWITLCTIPSWLGTAVELEMTHSLVSGDTYGLAWWTYPGGSANVGPKNGLPDSSRDRSPSVGRDPRTRAGRAQPPLPAA